MSCDRIIELVFQGLTAIGTMGAVIISLFLAFKTNGVKTRISYTYNLDVSNPDERSFVIIIVNESNSRVIKIQEFSLRITNAWIRVSEINETLNHADTCKIEIPFYKLFDLLVEASNSNVDKINATFVDSLGKTYNKKISIDEAGLNYDLDTSKPSVDIFPKVRFEKAFDWDSYNKFIDENTGKTPLVIKQEDPFEDKKQKIKKVAKKK